MDVVQQRPMRKDSQDRREGIHHPSNSEVPREVDLSLLDDFISADVVVAIDKISLANSWLQHGRTSPLGTKSWLTPKCQLG